VTKPFSMDELVARLRAALRREEAARPGTVFRLGRWLVSLTAATVTAAPDGAASDSDASDGAGPDGAASDNAEPSSGPPGDGAVPPGPETVHLTPTEWRLLEVLLRAPGQLIPATRLLEAVWGPGFERNSHYLRFHMARLRRKLEDDPPRPRYLLTEPGMGYRYQP
jgi:two-component system KDP operon response regulator KdpE